jgi:hypothetical protein
MKRHFSNRGEALSEVTAARVLANRTASTKTSFKTQADRRTGRPFWSSGRVEVMNSPKKRQPRQKEDVTISL